MTKVDNVLLQDTPVKFVGSITSGSDHLDTDWLKSAGIHYSVAEGCNSIAVAEYVIAVIAALQKMNLLREKDIRAGIIGVGKVGGKVLELFNALGFEVITCDPFRAENEANFISISKDEFKELDIITLHTPLTYEGRHLTYHLIDKTFLMAQKDNCILINTSRGAVIHFEDLKRWGEKLAWCLDVFENEPTIDFEVLDTSVIATPHIAGYSVQSKYRGIDMIYRAAVEQNILPKREKKSIPYPRKKFDFSEQEIHWQDVILTIYDPRKTTSHMKEALIENSHLFDEMRKNFEKRYEFQYVDFVNLTLSEQDQTILDRIGIKNLI